MYLINHFNAEVLTTRQWMIHAGTSTPPWKVLNSVSNENVDIKLSAHDASLEYPIFSIF